MEKIEKTKTEPGIITQEEFSSLQKAEKNLRTEEIFLNTILPALRHHEVSLEIKTDDKTGLRSAMVWQGNEMIFSTDDQGEVEFLELTKKGENIGIDNTPQEDN